MSSAELVDIMQSYKQKEIYRPNRVKKSLVEYEAFVYAKHVAERATD